MPTAPTRQHRFPRHVHVPIHTTADDGTPITGHATMSRQWDDRTLNALADVAKALHHAVTTGALSIHQPPIPMKRSTVLHPISHLLDAVSNVAPEGFDVRRFFFALGFRCETPYLSPMQLPDSPDERVAQGYYAETTEDGWFADAPEPKEGWHIVAEHVDEDGDNVTVLVEPVLPLAHALLAAFDQYRDTMPRTLDEAMAAKAADIWQALELYNNPPSIDEWQF